MAADQSAERMYGLLVRHFRAEAGMSHRDVARAAPCDPSYLSLLESGQRLPSPQIAHQLDGQLHARGLLVAARELVASERVRLTMGDDGTVSGGRLEEDGMERRLLLQRAIGIAGAAGLSGALNRLDAAGETLEDVFARSVEDWQEITVEYGRDIFSASPAQIADDLTGDVLAVRRLLDRSLPPEQMRDLQRVAAQLSALTAMTMGNLGETSRTRRWWRTSWTAAERCGDSDLAAWARARAAAQELFEGRHSPEEALAQADRAAAIAPRSGVGAAEALSARAQALAETDRDASSAAVRDLWGLFETMPGQDRTVFDFGESAMRLMECGHHTRTGHGDAPAAVDAAYGLYPLEMFRERAKIQLWHATWMVRSGDPTGGLGYATELLDGLSEPQRDSAVMLNARGVLDAVPDDAARGQAAAEYRELISS